MFPYLKKLGHRNYWPYYLTFLVAIFIFAVFVKDIEVRSFFFQIAASHNGSRPQYALGTAMISSIGVEVINAGDENQNASFTLEYKKTSSNVWRPAYTPQRSYSRNILGVNTTYFYGSLMFLDPATSYDFRATVADPDGGTGTVITGSAVTKSDVLTGSLLRTLYVAPTGNDSNVGTSPSAPLRTIQRAADISLPGDRIIVQPGTYRESVLITRSGTAANPILLESAQLAINPGSSPAVIEGGEPALAVVDGIDNWLPDDHVPPNAGVYYTTLNSWSPADNTIYVAAGSEKIYAYWYYPYDANIQTFNNFIEGLYCSANCAIGCCPAKVSGGYWYDNVNKKLYVRLPNQSDPDNIDMHVVKRNSYGLRLNGVNNVIVRGFQVRYNHVGLSLIGATVGTRDNILEKNVLDHNGSGLGLGGYSTNGASVYANLAQDNQIYDSKVSEWPWEAVKLNDVESDGLTVGAGKGNIIRRNTIHDVFNGIMMGIFWDQSNENYNKETDVADNSLYDIGDDAIEPEGASINVRIFNNRVYRLVRPIAAQAGVSLAPVTRGPLWVVRNTFSDVRQTAFKFSVDQVTTLGQTLIFHNTVYNRLADFMALLRIWPSANGLKALFRNNAFLAAGSEGNGAAGDGYILEDITSNHSAPAINLDLDYDALFTTRQSDCGLGCRFVKWINVPYSSLALFGAGSGQESHGIATDPRFTDANGNNFTPATGSSLVDAATLLGGINDNFIGRGPDIGAVESSIIICNENWSCGAWSACVNGNQTRACADANNCGTIINRPPLSQSCACVPVWQCSAWNTCVSNNQSRTCTDANSCGNVSGQPPLTQSCTSNPNCGPNWSCGAWSTCANSQQSRVCSDNNNCGTTSGQPPLSQGCNAPPICTPSWSCGAWGACVNGNQTRACADANNCGSDVSRPATSQICSATGSDHPDSGDLLVLANRSGAAVYFVANNGKKYVYPDAKTYFTWYPDFSKVQRVTTDKLDSYPPGGLVPYRAGSRLITHPNTNKVYAVEPGGLIRHIPSEDTAQNLYGSQWSLRVQDVIPGFFSTSYAIGAPLSNSWPNGILAKYNNDFFYIIANKKRKFTSISVLKLNNFDSRTALPLANINNYDNGYDIISLELALATFRPNVTETDLLGRDPASLGNMTDADGDGLSYYEETQVWFTDPHHPDSDGDGYNDGSEIKNGFNPLGAGSIERWLKR